MIRFLKQMWFASAVIVLLPFSLWAQNQTEFYQGYEVNAHEVLVKFRAPTEENIKNAEQDEDIDEAKEVGGAGVRLLHSRSQHADALVRHLSMRADVLYAEPNYIIYAVTTPTDPDFGELWGLQNLGQSILGVSGTAGADIDAVSAWDVSTGSRNNVITVVDTGIDYTHPDLAANIWSAPAAFSVTIGGSTINCAAGTHGFNALNNTCNPMDDNDHGTHVSGTIGAVANNGIGVVGVNQIASIMGTKFLNSSGSGSTAGAINAIEFAIQAKAAFTGTGAANVRVLSNSWGGGGFSQALLDEIKKANTNGMLFVAAAGNSSSNNDSTPFYPASYDSPNIVAVAATDNKDNLASFSNFGANSVELGAPGVSILSTIIGGNYAYYNGTSMATPHVSGSAALVLSACNLDTAGLRSNLLANVDLISSLTGKTITGGRLNVNKAILACSGPLVPDFGLSTTPGSQSTTAGNSSNYTVAITPSGGFSDTVTFGVTGLPSGANFNFNPTSVTTSGSSTMTITTSSSTPPGTYPLTISGTAGALTHTTVVSLTVTAPPTPDFTLSASPTSRNITRGTSTSYVVTETPSGGFSGTVTFSVTGLPASTSASFSPPSVTTSGSSTMTVITSKTAPRGTYSLTIQGTSGGLTRSTSVSLKLR